MSCGVISCHVLIRCEVSASYLVICTWQLNYIDAHLVLHALGNLLGDMHLVTYLLQYRFSTFSTKTHQEERFAKLSGRKK